MTRGCPTGLSPNPANTPLPAGLTSESCPRLSHSAAATPPHRSAAITGCAPAPTSCHRSDQKGPPRVEIGPFWRFKIPHLGFSCDRLTAFFLTLFELCVDLAPRSGGIGLCRSATRAPDRPWIAIIAFRPVQVSAWTGFSLAGKPLQAMVPSEKLIVSFRPSGRWLWGRGRRSSSPPDPWSAACGAGGNCVR